MDATNRLWLTEFTVTPHIAHAVEVLRAAIPRRSDIEQGGEGIIVTREFNTLTAESFHTADDVSKMVYQSFTLTDELKAATELLLATVAYHVFLIEQTYDVPDEDAIRAFSLAAVAPGVELPDGRLAAQNRLIEDVRRKLNIGFGLLDGGGEDSVTVLS